VTDDEAPGWDAIDAALDPLYPGLEPRHVAYDPPKGFVGGALQGCSAYPAAGHWHYITYGLSELYEPDPEDDAEWSGWGFELTCRVVRGTEDEPPLWPFTILNELAKYVNGNKAVLESGHRIDLGQPITGYPHLPDAPPTGLTVCALTLDPQLGRIDTPNGKVEFLQVVGVSSREKAEMVATSTADVLARLAEDNPLLITDPGRGSGGAEVSRA
jgi:Suppressor of fused protein (SUFU)